MSLTGDEIRHRLSTFAAKWSVYAGGERSEAQTYLNELFACYGQERSAVARFEEPQAGPGPHLAPRLNRRDEGAG